MDRRFRPEEVAVREEVRACIRDNLPADIRERMRLGYSPRKQDTVAWQRILNKKGWAAMSWPQEWGGQDWSPVQEFILLDELQSAPAPNPLPFNVSMVGPVIAMTITLAAVYAPMGFQGGLTGALFREFAFTLAGAVLISGFVALTLSPMMCSRFLKAHDPHAGGALARRRLILRRVIPRGFPHTPLMLALRGIEKAFGGRRAAAGGGPGGQRAARVTAPRDGGRARGARRPLSVSPAFSTLRLR